MLSDPVILLSVILITALLIVAVVAYTKRRGGDGGQGGDPHDQRPRARQGFIIAGMLVLALSSLWRVTSRCDDEARQAEAGRLAEINRDVRAVLARAQELQVCTDVETLRSALLAEEAWVRESAAARLLTLFWSIMVEPRSAQVSADVAWCKEAEQHLATWYKANAELLTLDEDMRRFRWKPDVAEVERAARAFALPSLESGRERIPITESRKQ